MLETNGFFEVDPTLERDKRNSQLARTIEILVENGRILLGVALVDMKTRFGASFLSYLIAIAWPLAHMGFLMVAYLLGNKLAPIGDDPAVFAGSGLLPYILCMYPGRMMTLAIIQNNFLLSLQIVKPIHLLAGRMLVETATSLTVCILFYSILLLLGVDFLPLDGAEAVRAVLATIYLGVAIGSVNAFLASVFGPFVVVGFVILMIFAYITSGVFFPPSMMPQAVREIADYNPIYHSVQWLRSAYYIDNSGVVFSPFYIFYFSSICLMIGLGGERFARGKYSN